jgi:outer membrane immunogenic protein
MRTLLILLATTSLVAAADLPGRPVPTAPVAAPWTGFYIGAHGGYGWGGWNGPLGYDDHNPAWPQPQYAFDTSDKSIDGSSWLAGVQIGANYQVGSVVLGVEADVSWTGLQGDGTFLPYPNNPPSPAWAIHGEIEMFGTARARLGYASGPLLIFATGGLAWAKVDSTIVVKYDAPPCDCAQGTSKTNHIGYAVGGGFEWMFARNWTINAQYLFLGLGEEDYAYVGKTLSGATYATDHHLPNLQLHTVRGGINYKFGP